MKTMAAIDLSLTKEVPLDVDVSELINSHIEVAMVGLGGESSAMPHIAIYLELRTQI
jgi:hypothetical protein